MSRYSRTRRVMEAADNNNDEADPDGTTKTISPAICQDAGDKKSLVCNKNKIITASQTKKQI